MSFVSIDAAQDEGRVGTAIRRERRERGGAARRVALRKRRLGHEHSDAHVRSRLRNRGRVREQADQAVHERKTKFPEGLPEA